MANFKITEKQYNKAVSEGITITADLDAANGNVAKAVSDAKNQAVKSGARLSDTNIIIPASNESTRHKAKKTLRYYTVSDFLKKIH